MDPPEGCSLMSSRRAMTVLEIDRDYLSAVGVSRSADGVLVHASVLARRPDSIDPANAAQMGQWVGERLRESGLARGRVTIALPRRDVVLKRLDIPEGVEDRELASLVKLNMTRQIAVAHEAVIDHGVPTTSGDTRFVLAGALPGERMSWLQEVAQSAGLKVAHIHLLARGIEPIASRAGHTDELLLGIALGPGSAEIVVLEAGRPVFARSVEIARPVKGEALDAYAERLAVEVKRTWMGYRVSPGASEIESILVLGDDELSRSVASRCGQALEMTSRAIACPGWIESRNPVPAELLALVGVASATGEDVLDFANPRKPADRSAGVRQLALVGVFAVIVLGGGGWLFANQRLGELRKQVTAARETQRTLASQTGELYRNLARSAHLEAWREPDTDWVAHLRWLSDRLPDPEDGLVNSISAQFEGGGVVFTATGSGLQGDWSTPAIATFSFGGSASREGLITELRERLLDGHIYRVSTVGADVGDKYAFRLATGELSLDIREGDAP